MMLPSDELAGGAGWDCEVYGPAGRQVGALCFMAGEPGTRSCLSPDYCAAIMAVERRRVFQRIQEQAAAGDPLAIWLAQQFSDPGQLLGGPGAGDG